MQYYINALITISAVAYEVTRWSSASNEIVVEVVDAPPTTSDSHITLVLVENECDVLLVLSICALDAAGTKSEPSNEVRVVIPCAFTTNTPQTTSTVSDSSTLETSTDVSTITSSSTTTNTQTTSPVSDSSTSETSSDVSTITSSSTTSSTTLKPTTADTTSTTTATTTTATGTPITLCATIYALLKVSGQVHVESPPTPTPLKERVSEWKDIIITKNTK